MPDQPAYPGAHPIAADSTGAGPADSSGAAATDADPTGAEVAGAVPPSTVDRAARQRRLADVFGAVLPELTSDDVPGDAPSGARDSWYLENRPPHH